MNIWLFLISCVLTNNFIFSKFLGCCPFLGVSSKVETAASMGIAVTFVMTLASLFAYMVNAWILVPLHLEYMQTIAFILVIASLVQFVEMFLKKSMPAIYSALGFLLAIVLMAGVRERLESSKIPACMKGFPISLVSAGLMAIAFMGFSGLV